MPRSFCTYPSIFVNVEKIFCWNFAILWKHLKMQISSNLGGYCDKKCTIKVHWRLNGSLQNHKHFYYETEWFKYKTLILFVFRNENLCVNLAFIINIWKRENGEKR